MKTFRLRLGIFLWLMSWMPFAQVTLYFAHKNGKLMGASASSKFTLTVWGIQIVVGLIGVALVGKLAFDEAKKAGWKKTPRRLLELFLHGPQEQQA